MKHTLLMVLTVVWTPNQRLSNMKADLLQYDMEPKVKKPNTIKSLLKDSHILKKVLHHQYQVYHHIPNAHAELELLELS